MEMKSGQAASGEGVEDGVCEVEYVDEEAVTAAKADLPQAMLLRAVADAFKTLAHPNRLRVLEALDSRELCVCDLAEVLGLSMSATSQQLRELRQLGAVQFRAVGKLAYYSLADRFWLDLGRRVTKRFTPAKTTQGSCNVLGIGVS